MPTPPIVTDADRKLARNHVENYCQHSEPQFRLLENGNCTGCEPIIAILANDIAAYRQQIVRETLETEHKRVRQKMLDSIPPHLD